MPYDLLITNVNLATMHGVHSQNNLPSYGELNDAAIAIKYGKIVWLDTMQTLQQSQIDALTVLDGNGAWLTPALIDCHTHLVFGGSRSGEFEQRLNGVAYETIAKNGGGIASTVHATRAASFDELYRDAARRLRDFIAQGVGTIEIKSGYGLTLIDERKMLQVARKLGQDFGITVQTTYLAAHALPPEYKDRYDDEEAAKNAYIDNVCAWLPILKSEGLIDAVDGFCENIAFNTEQMRRVFATAKLLGLPVKLHAEQLSNQNGAALVAQFDGLSADHIEYLTPNNVQKMAAANVAGVLLPTAFYTLRETQLPPIDAMRTAGVKMAVSTDCNPGTSPSTSLLLALNMACTLFKLTPQEALAGVTVNAAAALGLPNKGALAVGMDADLALWEIDRPADLCYLIGQNRLAGLWVDGKRVE